MLTAKYSSQPPSKKLSLEAEGDNYKNQNWSKCRELVTMPCPVSTDTSIKQTLILKAQEAPWKNGWKNCKSQKTRKFSMKLAFYKCQGNCTCEILTI